MVGMAFIAAQAKECFPFLNCETCCSWQEPQVSGVGILTWSTSLAEWCRSPWQTSQVMPPLAWRESCQSETMLGVTLVWQVTHSDVLAVVACRAERKIGQRRMRTATKALRLMRALLLL